VRDVVGLHMAPSVHALMLCVDEKSQIQALDCSQAGLPKRPGQPERRSHDYTRHGTTSLFAALDVATGQVRRAVPRPADRESGAPNADAASGQKRARCAAPC
jgi:hypothetical protein